MEDISAVITVLNEEKRLPALMKSLEGISDIVIIDSGSTDRTVELARELGARVYPVGDRFLDTTVTKADVKRFIDRFGWEPGFVAGQKFWSSGKKRNYGASLAKNDWIFNPDADEIVEWDLGKLRATLDDADQVMFHFQHKPNQYFEIGKLYRRSKYAYVGRVHEVVVPREHGARIIHTPHMTMTHHQTLHDGRDRTEDITVLEYAAITDSWERNLFYLGREYASRERWDEALVVLDEFLKVGKWPPEVAEVCFIRAQVYCNQQQYSKAKAALLLAIDTNPEFAEAFRLMAALSCPAHAKAWLRYAESATNEGVLDVRSRA